MKKKKTNQGTLWKQSVQHKRLVGKITYDDSLLHTVFMLICVKLFVYGPGTQKIIDVILERALKIYRTE